MQKKDIPNAICWFRIALIPIVLFFLIASPLTAGIHPALRLFLSGLLFSIAITSDLIDGKIARKYNYVTDLGKFLDPIADKLLVLSVLVAFCGEGMIHSIWVILILIRELLITGLRLSAASKGAVIAANMWGKVKTTAQGLAIIAVYLLYIADALWHFDVFHLIAEGIFALIALYTCISAIPYIKACAPYLKG